MYDHLVLQDHDKLKSLYHYRNICGYQTFQGRIGRGIYIHWRASFHKVIRPFVHLIRWLDLLFLYHKAYGHQTWQSDTYENPPPIPNHNVYDHQTWQGGYTQ